MRWILDIVIRYVVCSWRGHRDCQWRSNSRRTFRFCWCLRCHRGRRERLSVLDIRP